MFKFSKKLNLAAMITSLLLCIYSNVFAEDTMVSPMGKAVGVKIYTEGLLVVGISDDSPIKNSGIKVNDRITSADGIKLNSSEQLAEIVNHADSQITLAIDRNGSASEVSVKPKKNNDGTSKLGLWVRDSTAGIGTLTYYNPKNHTFAALGHGINDVDTGDILTVKSGNILPCKILSVTKSKNGAPGELNGSFDGDSIGEIHMNSANGIYGKGSLDCGDVIPVARPDEVREGGAYILADIDGNGPKQYDVEIVKVSPNNKAHKNLVISITDQNLLSLTGGIVQGMSGAPVIQDGKLAGALTHVFVNDADKGYGTFASDMVNISEKIK